MTWVIVGGIVAATAGLLTGSPNGLSLLGVLLMGFGLYRVIVGEGRVSRG